MLVKIRVVNPKILNKLTSITKSEGGKDIQLLFQHIASGWNEAQSSTQLSKYIYKHLIKL